jgi:hypothetical protein
VDPFHESLARIAFAASGDLGLVLAGGYAISAHRLTSRPSRDIDFATVSTLPLAVITDRLADVYRAEGFDVQVIEVAPTMARFEVKDGGRACEVDLLKAGIGPPVMLDIGPVLALDDAVGLKVGVPCTTGAHTETSSTCMLRTFGVDFRCPSSCVLAQPTCIGSRPANCWIVSTQLSSSTTKPFAVMALPKPT